MPATSSPIPSKRTATVKGNLFLIPSPLGEISKYEVVPPSVNYIVNTISDYIVEDERTARRYLKKLGIKTPIDQLTFLTLNKRTAPEQYASYLKAADEGRDMGLISDAGCPGIADPGADVVRLAHRSGIRVIPLAGPSSVIMALMASGLNGQNFAFHGYLPIERSDRIKRIKELEKTALHTGASQVFMETPYRNEPLLDDLLKTCSSSTLLCIACDISLQTEFICTRKISQWRNEKPALDKRPAIFIIGK